MKGNVKELLHDFEILDMGSNCNLILGLDIIPKLGVSIHNLPGSFPPDATDNGEDLKNSSNLDDKDFREGVLLMPPITQLREVMILMMMKI